MFQYKDVNRFKFEQNKKKKKTEREVEPELRAALTVKVQTVVCGVPHNTVTEEFKSKPLLESGTERRRWSLRKKKRKKLF